MPIVVHADIRRPSQQEFAQIAYDVMHHLFAIHNEFGRFLREELYKQELAVLCPGVAVEVAIEVSFGEFTKRYEMDVLADQSAVFELKTVETLVPKHRTQLLNYLLLAELPHGKLVNMRSEVVEHEFVNTSLRLADRRQFSVVDDTGGDIGRELSDLRDLFVALVSDWGTALELPLYVQAVTELLGGQQQVIREVDILSGDRIVGRQKVHLASLVTGFKITTIDQSGQSRFAEHAQRFLQHTRLESLLWINITLHEVTFRIIRRQKCG